MQIIWFDHSKTLNKCLIFLIIIKVIHGVTVVNQLSIIGLLLWCYAHKYFCVCDREWNSKIIKWPRFPTKPAPNTVLRGMHLDCVNLWIRPMSLIIMVHIYIEGGKQEKEKSQLSIKKSKINYPAFNFYY